MLKKQMNYRATLLLHFAVAIGGCSTNIAPPASDEPQAKFQAVATTGPVGDLVRQIAGERISLEVMMGPGVDPHLYRAGPSDLRKLDAADLIFFNGLHLEGRLTEVLESMRERKQVIAVTGGLVEEHDPRLLSPEDYEGLHDPHVWHDVSLWIDCTKYVTESLCQFDPEGETEYRANAAAYESLLTELHTECQQCLGAIPESARILVTAHDAFAYFSHAYGLESVGLKGISTEDEVDLGQMDAVAELIIERQAPCVFIETAVSPQIVEALVESCKSRGHTVRIGGELYADALGPIGSGAESYVGMIRANVNTIAEGLGEEIKREEE